MNLPAFDTGHFSDAVIFDPYPAHVLGPSVFLPRQDRGARLREKAANRQISAGCSRSKPRKPLPFI